MHAKLCGHDLGSIFKHPVDQRQIPDYSQHIKEPMDFSTAHRTLQASIANAAATAAAASAAAAATASASTTAGTSVSGIEGFTKKYLRDLALVFQNCYQYNQKRTAIYRLVPSLITASIEL
jgi:Bromodomain